MSRNLVPVGRAVRRISQAELARRVKMSRSWVSAIETGALEPDPEQQWQIAEALDLRQEQLFPGRRPASAAAPQHRQAVAS